MINKDKIVFNTKTYFTPSYTGVIGIQILKMSTDGSLLVKTKSSKPFVRQIKDVYNEEIHARYGGREWERDERKRKRDKHKKKNNLTAEEK